MDFDSLKESKGTKRGGLGLLLVVLMLTGLLAACGNDTNTAGTTSTQVAPTVTALAQTPVASTVSPGVVTTAATGTTNAGTSAAATTGTVAATTSAAVSTTNGATTVAAATSAVATTVAVSTTQAAPATTVAAVKPNAPVGNTYPAGPAPVAGTPAGGLVEVTLNVPDALKRGAFAEPHKLSLPQGFEISLYSQLQGTPRFGVFSPDGRLFVSERGGGRVVTLKDNGATGDRQVWAEGLNGPHGLAFHAVGGQMYLYVAEDNKVTRFPYQNGQARGDKKEVIVPNLPNGGGHSTRSIAFGPDNKMYIAAGSSCNVCEESDERRAAVTQYNEDGSSQRIFARGLRNEVGILFYPPTGELWGVENSRDNLGSSTQENNNIPPEEVNIIQDGKHYGWPYCYSNQLFDQNFGRRNADFCKDTVPPALPMQAHSAPLGLDFYMPSTMQFPADFQGDAFVAFHGSWNRSPATGAKVVRVRVKDGRPVSYEDFATGWLVGADKYWGRPVAPIVAPDGSLFVTDDTTNALYKITYKG